MTQKLSKIKKLLLSFFICLSILAPGFTCPMQYSGQDISITETQNDWHSIKELYLPSLIKQDSQGKEGDKDNQNGKAKDPHELVTEALDSISEEEKIKVGMGLFEKHASTNNYSLPPKIVDDTTYRDLTIFCGNPEKTEHNFVNHTNRAKTIAGRLAYLDLLYHPLCDIDQLTIRQNGIKELVQNEILYRELSEKLKKLAQTESKLLVCWHEDAQRTVDVVMEQFYVKDPIPCPQIPSFGNKWLCDKLAGSNTWIRNKIDSPNKWLCDIANQNSKYLDTKRTIQLATAPLFAATAFSVNCSKQLASLIAHPMVILTSSTLEGLIVNSLMLAGTWYLPEEYKINTIRTLIGSQVLNQIIQHYKKVYKTEQASLILHKMINEVSALMVITQEIIDLVKCYPAVNNAINTCMQNYNRKLLGDYDNLETLINLLDKECFKKEPRLFGLRGAALATFSLFKQKKDSFIPYYVFLGNIDALMSVATLLKETNEYSDNYYTYINYTKEERPLIALRNFWNPFLNSTEAIPNDITLDQNVILTGPNAGGKSTALKAIALSALLAQTLTIAPGSLELTPFNKIITLLNIPDIIGEVSGFQAHAQRVKFVLDSLNSILPHEFALIVPDELYNTTAEDVATALCSGIFKLISDDFPNARFIAATHYAGLNILESERKNRIKNYKIRNAKVDLDGNIFWTYKIKPGTSKQNIALQIVRKLYGAGGEQSEKILHEARNRLHQR